MEKLKNRFTIKIVLSYLLLILLASIASFYIFLEIKNYMSNDDIDENENKLLKTSTLLTNIYEAESLSKLALQNRKRQNILAYSEKIDSIYTEIEALKTISQSTTQTSLLDSLCLLLEKKVANNNALRKLKTQNQTGKAINHALEELNKMEASLGIITAENLAPNINELPPQAQESIRKMADYLNENIPSDESEADKSRKTDSILQISKRLITGIKEDNTINQNSQTNQESKINKTDLELSQQLRNIINSLEKEVLVSSINNNINREAALKRSIQLAVMAAILGFLVVGIFTFTINRDFWKANVYRQKLEKEKKYSESLLKSREQLIKTVSHDLRTPLNTIIGYSEIIEKSDLSPKQNEYLCHIKSAAGYVDNLVNDLLDFSRLEAGKINIKKVPLNLSNLIKESSNDLSVQYKDKDIFVILDIEDDMDRDIMGDPIRLRQIINNLLGNAFKFTEEGSISIKAHEIKNRELKSMIQVRITDTGIGISKEKQQLIFKEFTQAEINTEKKYGGYGLGLTISKKLVELLGGTMRLKSTVGSGSTFTITLPLEPAPEPIKSENPVVKETTFNQPAILIIDDDEPFIQMVGEFLKSKKIKPILHTDFNTIQTDDLNYEVVLTDIEMPSITGFEVLTRLKSGTFGHYSDQPIIAMTGRRDLDEKYFLSKGFKTMLQKPFSNTQLLNTIEPLLVGIEKVEKTTSGAPFQTEGKSATHNLGILRSFLGDDEKAINEVLRTFIKETYKNMEILKKGAMANDYSLSKDTAHRMLPMFRQLEVNPCIDLLYKLENTEAGAMDLLPTYKSLMKHITPLLETLKKRVTTHPNYTD